MSPDAATGCLNRKPGRPRRAVSVIALLIAPLALAACGSTVQVAGQTARGGDGLTLSGSGVAASGSSGTTGLSLPGPNGASGATISGGATGIGAGTGAANVGSRAASSGSATTGAGPSTRSSAVRPAKVTIGAWVAGSGFDSVAASLGIKGLALGNQTNQVQALVKDINTHGGLLGAKIDLVLHVTKTSDTNQTAEAQAVCADFTEDHHVQFAITGLDDATGLVPKCLAAHGVPLINDDYSVDNALLPALSPYLFLPSAWVMDRLMQTQIDALNGQGFFDGPGKVGILLYDTPASQRVLQHVVIPGLAAIGVKSPDTYALKSDGSDYEAESPGVLRFRADGVTRIITIQCSPLGFMINAESQHYNPRYAVYTTSGPGALLETAAPKNQLKGSVGFGWSPPYDVDGGHQPAPVSANQTRCWSIMKKAGEDTSGTAGALQLWFCDAFWFLQKALDTAGVISASGLVAGARAMRGYESPVTWRTDLSSGRIDGVSAYRDLAYNAHCSCYLYTSGLKPASS